MTTYIFNDKGRGRTFTVVETIPWKEFNNRKRIGRFEKGKLTTTDPKVFLKLHKKFDYTIKYDKPKMDYKIYHRNDLVSEAAKRGMKDVLTRPKVEIIKMLEIDDAKKVVKKK